MSIEEKPSLQELYHYGIKRRSGRYPWGSGDDPYQHGSEDYLNRVEELKKQGLSDDDIAKSFGQSSTEYRMAYRTANNERKRLEIEKIKSLKEKGYSNYKIGEMMGISESSVRSKIDPHSVARLEVAKNTADFLKKQMEEKKYIDVGKDVERELNISRGQLDEALYLLKAEGYVEHEVYLDQMTNPGKQTTYKVLCPAGTELKDVRNNISDIQSVTDYTSGDNGQTYHKRFVYPKSMDSSRLQIRYAEDGGIEKDGIIELRRGVDDLSLGNSRYAQVRILVDNDRYLKGVAVYSDDMPDGVDVVFNTNKTKDVPMRKVLKEIKSDPDNPFGSSIKDIEQGGQYYYKDKNGKEQLGLINKRSDEGDWSDWSNNLPSQFLSKQPLSLAKRQLNLDIDAKKAEYDEICSLTNPTVKKKLLEDFADGCDSSAVHLKAAALPRQQYHVIIPITSLKDTEVYAPNYKDGEQVALIRYPHGGTFEIPILTVNNKHATAKKLLGTDIVDAVGINSKVAERLSGADFDGDTVMVIPTGGKINIKSSKPLEGLEGFDPKLAYATTEKDGAYYNSAGQKIKVMRNTGNEMGRISNLITDMTLKGAAPEELARAVKHSMVVIDAEKHKLDYKQSEIDNNIKQLRETYQRTYDPETGEYSGGASTLISRAKSQQSVLKRQGIAKINMKDMRDQDMYDPNKPEGSLVYKKADDLYYPEMATDKNNPGLKGYRLANGKKVMYDPEDKDKVAYYRPVKTVDESTGKVKYTNSTGELEYRVAARTQKSTKMAETDDARTLISDYNTPMERLYADYANKMKYLANEARKTIVTTGEIKYNASANQTYSKEVESLLTKLNEAQKNSPRERQAQALANSEVNAKMRDNPDLKKNKEELKKLKQQALERNRAVVGASRKQIEITDQEWEAIQAGAISKTKLKDILNYADMDVVRSKAMPRASVSLSKAQMKSLQAKYNTGRYTTQQLADFYGVSASTIHDLLNGKE